MNTVLDMIEIINPGASAQAADLMSDLYDDTVGAKAYEVKDALNAHRCGRELADRADFHRRVL